MRVNGLCACGGLQNLVMHAHTVLVAVESQGVREAIVAMLSTVDTFRVVGAVGTKDQALECARRERPALAVVDQGLADCGAWWLMHSIRQEALARAVVALGLRANCYEAELAGAQAYVQMGVSPRELVGVLEDALRRVDLAVEAEQDLLPDAHPVLVEPALVDL